MESGSRWWILGIVGFALKVPLGVLVIIFPNGAGGVIPDTGGSVVASIGNLGFLAAVLLLLTWRRWVGAVAAVVFGGLSAWAVPEHIANGDIPWAVYQGLTTLVGVAGVVIGAIRGALQGSRW